MEKTTIQIFVETRDHLRRLGERNEDYDSIINRAIAGDFSLVKGKKTTTVKEAT